MKLSTHIAKAGLLGLILILSSSLGGCGGGGGSGATGGATGGTPGGTTGSTAGCAGSGSAAGILMGGARQGVTLNLAGTTNILADQMGSNNNGASFSNGLEFTTDGVNLYVADQTARVIRKIVIATCQATILAGSGAVGSLDGTGVAASFDTLGRITTDGTNLYVTDWASATVRKIVIATGAVTTLAGTAGVYGSVDGTGAAASFSGPSGITTDGKNLYVADGGGAGTIRKIVIATGAVSTLAGTPGIFGVVDGTGAAASFSSPGAITTDGTSLFVTDNTAMANGLGKIRKIEIATGAVTTLAGAFSMASAVPFNTTPGLDGTGSAATFNTPTEITSDGTNLYVLDYYSAKVRKIVISTAVVTTLPITLASPHGLTNDGASLYTAGMGTAIQIK